MDRAQGFVKLGPLWAAPHLSNAHASIGFNSRIFPSLIDEKIMKK